MELLKGERVFVEGYEEYGIGVIKEVVDDKEYPLFIEFLKNDLHETEKTGCFSEEQVIQICNVEEGFIYTSIKNEVERVGYELLNTRKTIDGKNYDENIRFVIAYSESKQEFVTWLYNIEFNSLAWGHYYNHWFGKEKEQVYNNALNDFHERK